MIKEYRKVYDYHYHNQFLFRLGHARFQKAHPPIPLHEHGNMTEFVFLEKGTQNYQTIDKVYTVQQGEVFFTKPNEPHSTGILPEEISVIYYLIVDLCLVSEIDAFIYQSEYSRIENYFLNIHSRIFKPSPRLKMEFNRLLEIFAHPDIHFDTRIRNALAEVLIALSTLPSPEKNISTREIESSMTYIQENLNNIIHISDLAQMENMSLSAYKKKFVQVTGIPPGEYILQQKIKKSKELLLSTQLSITEIAFEYGFSSSQYFATVFKRLCYMSPSEFRKVYYTPGQK